MLIEQMKMQYYRLNLTDLVVIFVLTIVWVDCMCCMHYRLGKIVFGHCKWCGKKACNLTAFEWHHTILEHG